MQSDQRSGSDDSGPPADDSPASGTSQSNSARSSSAAGPSAASPSSADAAPSASGGKSDAPRPTPSVSDEPHEEFVIEEGVPENEELLRERIKTLVIGKPRDLADKSVFQHVSLVAFLAWVGLGADGLLKQPSYQRLRPDMDPEAILEEIPDTQATDPGPYVAPPS